MNSSSQNSLGHRHRGDMLSLLSKRQRRECMDATSELLRKHEGKRVKCGDLVEQLFHMIRPEIAVQAFSQTRRGKAAERSENESRLLHARIEARFVLARSLLSVQMRSYAKHHLLRIVACEENHPEVSMRESQRVIEFAKTPSKSGKYRRTRSGEQPQKRRDKRQSGERRKRKKAKTQPETKAKPKPKPKAKATAHANGKRVAKR